MYYILFTASKISEYIRHMANSHSIKNLWQFVPEVLKKTQAKTEKSHSVQKLGI